MYEIKRTATFKSQVKKIIRGGRYKKADLEKILYILSTGESIPEKYLDHQLQGQTENVRELHIKPDWLLVYRIDNDVLVLTLSATGTHSDLFDHNQQY